jgi:SulP family sulfate permease
MGLEDLGVKVIGEVPSGFFHPGLPPWSPERVLALLPGALTLALVGFMQTISIGKVLATTGRYQIDANQELRALGVANLAAGMSQGYSVTGGLSRSLVNARAGARTQLASVVTAILIAATLLFLTPLFYHLPKAVLGAIVFVSVFGLVDVKEMKRMVSVRWEEGGLLAFTFIATLLLGIQNGLLLGIGASILLFIIRNTRPNAALLGRLPGTEIYRSLYEFPNAEREPGIVILRIDASYYFANAEFIKNKLREIRSNMREPLRAVILDAAAINDLDSTADAALHEILNEYEEQGLPIYIANVKGPVRRVMKRSGLYSRLGGDRFFFSIGAAVERARRDTKV